MEILSGDDARTSWNVKGPQGARGGLLVLVEPAVGPRLVTDLLFVGRCRGSSAVVLLRLLLLLALLVEGGREGEVDGAASKFDVRVVDPNRPRGPRAAHVVGRGQLL